MLSPLVILIILSPILYSEVVSVKTSYSNATPINKFEAPMKWLKENSEKNSIVFHSDWDEFPILFYHNDHNLYLVGLDPTFMYEYDQDLYQRFVDITTGVPSRDLYPVIKDLFNAKYVFVDIKQNADFDRNLTNNFYFEKVFENQEARIYKVADDE